MATPKRFSQLPREVSTRNLMPMAQPGEPTVVLMLNSVGNTSPFRMQGRTNRIFYFAYDRAKVCHILYVPLSVWQIDKLALAKELLDQKLYHPVLIDVISEPPAEVESQDEIERLTIENGELILSVAGLTKTVCELRGETVPDEVLEILTDPNAPPLTSDLDPEGNPLIKSTPEEIEKQKQALSDQTADATTDDTSQSETDISDSGSAVSDIITEATSQASTPANTEPLANEQSPLATPAISAEIIKEQLPIRLNALAEKLGKSPAEVRAVIEAPDSGLVIKNAGWIGLAE